MMLLKKMNFISKYLTVNRFLIFFLLQLFALTLFNSTHAASSHKSAKVNKTSISTKQVNLRKNKSNKQLFHTTKNIQKDSTTYNKQAKNYNFVSYKKKYRYVAIHGRAVKKHFFAKKSNEFSFKRDGFVKVANEFRNNDDAVQFASASIFVVDQLTGSPIISKNPDQVSPIASISKLMTAMIVLDSNQDMNMPITISQEDVDTLRYSRSRIPVGATMTRETALLLALMSSENRVANALARHFPGGFPAFVQAMNRKAADLGMSHTHFRDPTGLSNNNVSTARDLSKLVTVASLYPKIREATTMAEAQVSLGGTLAIFSNTNTLVNSPDWSIGVSKTGYIQEAGRCLVMQARVASKPVAIVLLDSANKGGRQDDALRIKRLIEANRS